MVDTVYWTRTGDDWAARQEENRNSHDRGEWMLERGWDEARFSAVVTPKGSSQKKRKIAFNTHSPVMQAVTGPGMTISGHADGHTAVYMQLVLGSVCVHQ